MRGIVTCIKRSSNTADDLYTVVGSEASLLTKSALTLELFESIDFAETHIGTSSIAPRILGRVSEAECNEVVGFQLHSFALYANAQRAESVNKICPHSIFHPMIEAALVLLNALVRGSPIIVRFHRDGDGSSGSIALYLALNKLSERFNVSCENVTWQANRSIAYTADAMVEDTAVLNLYTCTTKPVLLLIDFGTSEESVPALSEASQKFDVIMIDHHVPGSFDRKLVKHYINSWDFESDSSVAAGFLAGVFSEIISAQEFNELKMASLISEFSAHADNTNSHASKIAAVLDYLTGSAKDEADTKKLKPRYMYSVLTNSEKCYELYNYAQYTISEAISRGMQFVKMYTGINGLKAYTLDFARVLDQGVEYPPPGRYCSILQSKLEANNKGNTATIVYHNRFASIRISRDVSKSIDIVAKIDGLSRTSRAIISGGGHPEAAAVRYNEPDAAEAVRALLSSLGVSQPN